MNYDYDRTRTAAEGINWSVVRQVAAKAIRAIGRPASSRKGALKQIADAVAGNDLLMSAFASIVRDGSFSYHSVADTLGEAVAIWKDNWEISEDDPKYEGLTTDVALQKAIQALTTKWTPKGPITQPRDYTEAGIHLSHAKDLLRRLAGGSSRNEEEDRLEVLRLVEQVEKLLK